MRTISDGRTAAVIRVMAGAAVFLIASCTRPLPIYLSADERIPPAMRAMCEKDGGTRIYKTVENVRGFYAAGRVMSTAPDAAGRRGMERITLDPGCNRCSAYFWRDGYEFIEMRFVDYTRKPGYPYSPGDWTGRLMDDKGDGIYRYRLRKAGHPDCALYHKYDELHQRLYGHPADPIVINGRIDKRYCVASVRIDKPMARYEVETEVKVVWENDDSTVRRKHHYIRDRRTGEILAESVQYVNWRREHRRYPKTPFRCPVNAAFPETTKVLLAPPNNTPK